MHSKSVKTHSFFVWGCRVNFGNISTGLGDSGEDEISNKDCSDLLYSFRSLE